MSSEDKDQEDKTEEPTSKRLSDARGRGQVAKSRELNSFGILLIGGLSLAFLFPIIAADLINSFTGLWEKAYQIDISMASAQELLGNGLLTVAGILSVFFLAIFIAAALTNLAQHGLIFSLKPLEPQLSRISLLKNLKQKLGMQNLIEFIKGIFKLIAVFVIGGIALLPVFDILQGLFQKNLIDFVSDMMVYLILMFIGVLTFMLLVSFLDIFFQRFNHRKQLRMTKQEIKEEYKNMEGDPHVKARLNKIRMERSRKRMMEGIPDADVVITNPTHFAVVLKYDQETMMAPVVVAKGQDYIALRIKDMAHEHNVTVVENPPLARGLFAASEIDDEIPEEFFQPVAEIITYVWGLNKKKAA